MMFYSLYIPTDLRQLDTYAEVWSIVKESGYSKRLREL
jgi:hypothetical protein